MLILNCTQNIIETSDWIQVSLILVTGIGIIINALIVNQNTNKQIKNQNKENYRPRLKLDRFENRNRGFINPEYMVSSKNFKIEKEHINFYSNMILKNIGYGLANDITFYDLCTGEQIVMGLSGQSEINQKLFSTEEIPNNQEEVFSLYISADKETIDSDEIEKQDFFLILCNYQDLNKNNYKIIIGYIIKKNNEQESTQKESSKIKCNPTFDCYYYQENTTKYNEMIKKYYKNYKKIVKKIK